MRILLVEPDRMLAANIGAILGGAGHKVEWHVNPQEAVNSLDDKSADMVIMDLVLCQHSAIEMLYEMRSYSEWQSLPVIIYSSLPAREVLSCVASLEQLGVTAYHHKSFTPLSELVHTIEKYQPSPIAA